MISIKTWRFWVLSLMCFGVLVVCPMSGQTQGLDDLIGQASTAQNTGRYAEAASLYARATFLSPAQAELWSNRGVMEFLAGDASASIVSLKRSLLLNHNLFTPKLFLGKDYLQEGRPALALPYLTQAHAARANDVEVLLALGRAKMDMEQPRSASASYAEAAKAAPTNTNAWFGLGVSSLALISKDGQELAGDHSIWANALYADELLEQGRPLQAEETYKTALTTASLEEKATLAENLAWMQAHPSLFPLPQNSHEALQRLTTELQTQTAKTYAVACTTYRQPANPVLPASLLKGAACAYREGDYERSAADAESALETSPHAGEALFWSVKSNERIALAALARFEELAPQSPQSYVLVGDLYRMQNQNGSAVSEYQKALAIDAHAPSALRGAVMAYLSLSKLDEAASTDRTALADRPTDPQLNLLMAEILDAAGKHEQVEGYLAKCSNAPPEMQPRVHYLLGRAYAEEGRTDIAIQELQLALPGDKDGSIHYQLARLYRKTGNTVEADKLFTEAKALIGKRDANASIVVRESTAQNP